MDEEVVLYRSVASRSFAAIWMLEELELPSRTETIDGGLWSLMRIA